MTQHEQNPFIGASPAERARMVAALGLGSVSDLFATVPEAYRYPRMEMPARLSEMELMSHARTLARQNLNLNDAICVLGAGSYRHYVPPLSAMLVLQPSLLAGYQLSQAELHQGLLQLMYEFQELIQTLTGMEVANSGLYDGASSLAEAVLMTVRLTGRRRVLIARSVHPEWRAVVRTYCSRLSLSVEEIPFDEASGTLDSSWINDHLDDAVACVVVQQVNFFGVIESLASVARAAHAHGALAVAVSDPIGLALLQPPGDVGFDLVVGDGQPLGHAPRFGGAQFGFLATRFESLSAMPGLYVRRGSTREGAHAFTLAQQAKSARTVLREKAPSNVGTSSVIPALIGGAYLAAMGPDGLRRAALLSQQGALSAAEILSSATGARRRFDGPFFREFALDLPGPVRGRALLSEMAKQGIVGPYPLADDYPELERSLLFCFTEMNGPHDARRVGERLASLQGAAL